MPTYLDDEPGQIPGQAATPPETGVLGKIGTGLKAGADLGIGPKAMAAIQAALPVAGDDPTFAARYTKQLKSANAERAQEESQGGIPYGIAKFAGGLPAAIGSGIAGLPGMVGLGALQGASAAPTGEEIPAAGKTGLATYLFARGAQAIAPSVENFAINNGRRAINAISNRLSAKPGLPAEVIKEASDSGAFKILGGIKGIATRLGKSVEEVGAQYGNIISGLEKQGVTGPDAEKLALSMLARGDQAFANTALPAVRNRYGQVAGDLVDAAGGNKTLGLTQAENIKRAQQAMSNYGEFKYTPVETAQKDVASMIRAANEQAIADQAVGATPEVQKLAADFVPVKSRLGNLIQAKDAADIGLARSSGRAGVSLPTRLAGVEALMNGNPGKFAIPLVSHAWDKTGAQTAAALAFGAGKAGPYLKAPAQTLLQQKLAAMLRGEKEPEDAP